MDELTPELDKKDALIQGVPQDMTGIIRRGRLEDYIVWTNWTSGYMLFEIRAYDTWSHFWFLVERGGRGLWFVPSPSHLWERYQLLTADQFDISGLQQIKRNNYLISIIAQYCGRPSLNSIVIHEQDLENFLVNLGCSAHGYPCAEWKHPRIPIP